MNEAYTVETAIRIYDNDSQSMYEIAPDQEFPDCVAVFYTQAEVTEESLCVAPAMARLIANALLKIADSIEKGYDK